MNGLGFLRKHRKIAYKIKWIYYSLCKRNRLQKHVYYGDLNPKKTIYIVRPDSQDCIEGLLSLAARASLYIRYGLENHYEVYVDWQKYKTQYYTEGKNAWEYFFEQPTKCTYTDVYQSENVVLSGWTFKDINPNVVYSKKQFEDKKLNFECHEIIKTTLKFSSEVKKKIEEESERLNIADCIGLYVRGTDYVRLKPSGEYVQPGIDDIKSKVSEFNIKYPSKKFFLVTEDGNIYDELKKVYGDRICTVSFDSFIYSYKGDDFLSKSNVLNDNKKDRGIDYLVKMALLSMCDCLITSITMGSMFSYGLNGGRYKDVYVFDLGLYP